MNLIGTLSLAQIHVPIAIKSTASPSQVLAICRSTAALCTANGELSVTSGFADLSIVLAPGTLLDNEPVVDCAATLVVNVVVVLSEMLSVLLLLLPPLPVAPAPPVFELDGLCVVV